MPHPLHKTHIHHPVRDQGFVAAGSKVTRTLAEKASRVLLARATSTCKNDSDPGCTKPTQTPTLAIALGIAIPVIGLAVVLVYLHFRNKKKLIAEDARDKYNSLDFGLEPGVGGVKDGKKGPEMSVSEKEMRGTHDRGLSLETGSPYILPVGLHGSRESFHSMSRSQFDPHDPYRPVTFLKDDASVRSPTRVRGDHASVYTASSVGTQKDRMGDGLLKNASRMSRSPVPVRGDSLSPDGTRSPDSQFPESVPALSPLNPRLPNKPLPLSTENEASGPKTQYAEFKTPDVPKISIPEPAVASKEVTRSPVETTEASFPPRVQSQQAVVHHNVYTNSILSTSSYGEGFQVTPPSPRLSLTPEEPLSPKPLQPQPQRPAGLGVENFGGNANRLSMSLRPLPSDNPEEDPEQRANRIRSFYKEYFDDSKPEPVGANTYTDYYEDYGSEYQDGTLFDSRNGNFIVAQPNAPFAEPITRRAMTPPPRAPPRFRSGTTTGPSPHMSNGSIASSQFPPRGMSSMSGRLPAPARKPLPPPSALSSLPTPAKLTENSMVFDPIDFAPPVSFRERQNGMRPDSPLGTPRPYSPAVRPHTPLVGSYDELPVLPSPHLMRKSGTFTALDFAPPGRIRDPAGSGASDAGSIRSNRSGISAVGRFAVRSGANRVSRIPREVVGTRDDFMVQLRPQMNLVSKA
ncbi:hypothetical protein LEMA_P046510.1 [Plenodomus lingam JN3]|uniref:Uncharacterized protein n=1 Tax=Leptosphaeria maculans (strain JN3 / isolate v23.1.3 / race Av1-4-5-6-7-8) TaxID=985895 RepID=E5R4H7_LEPMJ|nr:hypothetical protein LEMA_P046510.1 [Plenodomus lingam JN3]CBX91945.1 hypothetical protein LEMA_P046510.1 [Plenodomus lingam JN3]